MNDEEILNECYRLVEYKTGWRSSTMWTARDFEKLTEIIYKKSGIMISVSTLKRIFGKTKLYKDSYTPQGATKNALAIYLDYVSWDDFAKNFPSQIDPVVPYLNSEAPSGWSQIKLVLFKPIAGIVLLLVVVVSYFGVKVLEVGNRPLDKPLFRVDKHVGLSRLNVNFFYDLENIKSDLIYLDKDDNSHHPLIKLSHHSCCKEVVYDLPGYYKPSLIINDKAHLSDSVHVLTNGWEGYLLFNGEDRKIKKEVVYSNGTMLIPKNFIGREDSGKVNPAMFWTYYVNSKDFKLNGDDFSFLVKARNDPLDGGLFCNDISIHITGSNSDVKFDFVDQPECKKWVELQVGELRQNGRFHNLGVFVKPLKKWNIFKVIIHKNVARVYYNNTNIYSTIYKTSIGAIKTIGISFAGVGRLDYVRMYDEKRQMTFSSEFD